MVTCLLCNRPHLEKDSHNIYLSEAEKKQLQEQGVEPLEKYSYCIPCWKTLSDPTRGPAVFRGLFEYRLRQLGVSNAESLASNFHAKLVSWATKPRS